MLIQLFIFILLVVLGTMMSLGKWSFLIAGYNTMSKEEKERYDETALCKFMGKFMFVVAFCFLLMVLSQVFAI